MLTNFLQLFAFDVHSAKAWIGLVAGLIQLGTLFPYLKRLCREGTESSPSVASAIIWASLGLIGLLSWSQQEGRHEAMWIPLMCVINPIIIGVVAVRLGAYKPLDAEDKVCLTFAVAAGAFLVAKPEHPAALWISLVGDLFAVWATIRNVREHPQAEPLNLWATYSLGCLLNLLATDWSEVSRAALPAYTTAAVVWIVVEIRLSQNRVRKRALQPAG